MGGEAVKSSEAGAFDEMTVQDVALQALLTSGQGSGLESEPKGEVPVRQLPELKMPYTDAGRRKHALLYGSLRDEAKRWQVAFAAQTLLVVVLVVVFAINYHTPKVIPYIVQADEHGYTVAIGPAERHSAAEERQIIYEVGNFIRTLRTVVQDREAQYALITETYYHLSTGTPVRREIDEWYASNNPMQDGAAPKTIEVTRVQPLEGSDTLMVEWTETERGQAGQRGARYSALIGVDLRTVMTQEEVLTNPVGLFIKEFSVSRLNREQN